MCPRHPALTTGSQLPSHTPSCTIIKGRKEGATIRPTIRPTIQPTTRPYETIRPYELTMDTRLRKLSIVGRMMFLYMLPNMLLKLTGSKCQARFSSNVDMDWRWSFEALWVVGVGVWQTRQCSRKVLLRRRMVSHFRQFFSTSKNNQGKSFSSIGPHWAVDVCIFLLGNSSGSLVRVEDGKSFSSILQNLAE
jgi:hypothetical protein